MVKVAIFLAEGFEEAEALVPADLLRRAGADVILASVDGSETVTGAHGICVKADCPLDTLDRTSLSCIMLPGGLRGTELLYESFKVRALIQYAVENGLYVSAICAAPSILGKMGLLDGRRYACYPGFEKFLEGAEVSDTERVVRDGKIITAAGMGVALDFGLCLVSCLKGQDVADEIRKAILAD